MNYRLPPNKPINDFQGLREHFFKYQEVLKEIKAQRDDALAKYNYSEMVDMTTYYFQAGTDGYTLSKTIHMLERAKDTAEKYRFTKTVDKLNNRISEVKGKMANGERFCPNHELEKMMDNFIVKIKRQVEYNEREEWKSDLELLEKEARQEGIKEIRGHERRVFHLWQKIYRENQYQQAHERYGEVQHRRSIESIESHLKNIEKHLKSLGDNVIRKEGDKDEVMKKIQNEIEQGKQRTLDEYLVTSKNNFPFSASKSDTQDYNKDNKGPR